MVEYRTVTIEEGDGTTSTVQVPIEPVTSDSEPTTTSLPAIGASDPQEDQSIAPAPSPTPTTTSEPAPTQYREVEVVEGDGTVSTVRVPIEPVITETTVVAETSSPIPQPTSSISPTSSQTQYRTVTVSEGDGTTSQIRIPITPVTVPVLREAPSLVSSTGNSLLERQIAKIDEGDSGPTIESVGKAEDLFKIEPSTAEIFDVTQPKSEYDILIDKAAEAVVLMNKNPYDPKASEIILELTQAGQTELASKVMDLTKDARDFETRVNNLRTTDPGLSKAAADLGLSDRAALLLMDMPYNSLTEAQKAVRLKLTRMRGGLSVTQDDERLTAAAQNVRDSLIESLTFGKAETRTFNADDLGLQWDQLRNEAVRNYAEAVRQARAEGKEVGITLDEYIGTAIPGRDEYIEMVLAAMPTLQKLAAETGKASIPIYGTIYTWEDDPNWARALSIAGDVATFLPVLGVAAGFTRAGTSFSAAARAIAISELKAPFDLITSPIKAAKAGAEGVEAISDLLRTVTPDLGGVGIRTGKGVEGYDLLGGTGFLAGGGSKKLPVSVTEVASRNTQRIPLDEAMVGRPTVVPVNPESIEELRKLTAKELYALREELTQKAIRGEVNPKTGLTEIELPGGGIAGLATPTLQQRTGAAAFSSTPDGRNILAGMAIGDIDKPRGKGAPLFFAPGRMQRFLDSTSSGRPVPLTERAKIAIALGELPEEPIQVLTIVRGNSPYFKLLEDSKKVYKNQLEIETIIPPKEFSTRAAAESQVKQYNDLGVDASIYTDVDATGKTKFFAAPELPKPEQILFQRDPFTGKKNLVAVYGDPFTRMDMLKLKLLGPWEDMKQILTPGAAFFRRGVSDNIDKGRTLAKEAADYYEQAKKARAAGFTEEARRLERRGDSLLINADAAMQRATVNQFAESTFTSGATYTGDQDVERALRTLAGEPVPTRVPGNARPIFDSPPTPRAGIGGGRIEQERPRAPQTEPEITRVEGRPPERDGGIVEPPRGTPPPPREPRDTPRIERGTPPPPPPRTPPPPPRTTDVPPPPELRTVPVPPPPDVRPVPRPPDIISRPRLRLSGDSRPGKRREGKKTLGYSWLQGRVWVGIYAPFGEENIVYDTKKPENTERVKGPTEAWDSIRRSGYKIETATLDEWAQWFTAKPSRRRGTKMVNENEEFEGISEEEIPIREPAPRPSRGGRNLRQRIDLDIVPRIGGRSTGGVGPTAGQMRPAPKPAPIRAGGFAWPMGNIYVGIYPPFTEDDITYQVTQPQGATLVRGPKEAWNRIKKMGYEPDANTYDEWAGWFTAKGETSGIEGALLGNIGSGFETPEGGLRAFEPKVDDFFNNPGAVL